MQKISDANTGASQKMIVVFLFMPADESGSAG
jgi:hypothetical protein